MPQVWGRGLDLRDTVPKNATESFHHMGIKISELLLADGICRWDVTSLLKRLIQTDLLKASHIKLLYRKAGSFQQSYSNSYVDVSQSCASVTTMSKTKLCYEQETYFMWPVLFHTRFYMCNSIIKYQ